MKKTFVTLTTILVLSGTSAIAQNQYLVTTIEDKVETDSLGNIVKAEEATMTPEEKFLDENFPHLTLCEWKAGMKFMVIPGNKDEYIRTFTDSISGSEVATASLKHKIMIYRGHETTSRGWEHLNFYCPDNQKPYYMELRNFTFDEYCQKVANGGVRSLAYLGDVDKARELLIGKEVWSRGETFFKDDKTAAEGFREVPLKEDSHMTIEQVGVGTRDFPVKIVARADDGSLYYQNVAMSRTNCTLLLTDFYRESAKHLFSNSFCFSSKSGKNSATMSAKLLGKKINSRQPVKLLNKDQAAQTLPKNTVFLVKDIKGESDGVYYTLTLGNAGNDYTIRVTFENKDVSGNIDGKQEGYFYELFSIGTEFNGNNSKITHTATASGNGTGGYAAMMSGIISKGMTKEQVRMSKGEPESKWNNKNGTTSWKYADATYTFNKSGRVSNITEAFSYSY